MTNPSPGYKLAAPQLTAHSTHPHRTHKEHKHGGNRPGRALVGDWSGAPPPPQLEEKLPTPLVRAAPSWSSASPPLVLGPPHPSTPASHRRRSRGIVPLFILNHADSQAPQVSHSSQFRI